MGSPTSLLEEVKELLRYEPDTGDFYWRYPQSNFHKGGKAGALDQSGYTFIMIKRKRYLAHRLAWFVSHGEWPAAEIDHINGEKTDNRIGNLRLATRSQNGRNTSMSPLNTSGYKGVTWRAARQKWVASIMVHRKWHYLGGFDRIEDAAKAYESAAERLHGEFRRAS